MPRLVFYLAGWVLLSTFFGVQAKMERSMTAQDAFCHHGMASGARHLPSHAGSGGHGESWDAQLAAVAGEKMGTLPYPAHFQNPSS